MKRLSIIAVAALIMTGCGNRNQNANNQNTTDMDTTQEYYTFKLIDKLTRLKETVRYCLGITHVFNTHLTLLTNGRVSF